MRFARITFLIYLAAASCFAQVKISGTGVTMGGSAVATGYGNQPYGMGGYGWGNPAPGVQIGVNVTIPATFFGLQINNLTNLGANVPLPSNFHYGTLRFWDLAQYMEFPFLFPTNSTPVWGDDATQGFDYWMRFAKTNGLQVVLNTGRTPDWASAFGSRCVAAGNPNPSCLGAADFTCGYSGNPPTPPAGECWGNVDLFTSQTVPTGTDATYKGLVQTVAQHLAGLNPSTHVITAIWEPGNEVNIGGQFSGCVNQLVPCAVAQLVTMTRDASSVILAANSRNAVTTPNSVEWAYPLVTGVSAYQGNFMADPTVAANVSYLSIHSYMAMNGSTGQFPCIPGPVPLCNLGVAPPEELVNLIASVRRNVPTWPLYGILDSEFSWGQPNTSFCDPDMRKAYIARNFLIGWGLGISSMDWYHYDDTHNCSTALATLAVGGDAACISFGGPAVPGTGGAWVECPVGVAYQQTYGWMVGNVMDQSCSGPVPPDLTNFTNWGFWVCHFVNSDGTQALAVWNTDPAYTCSSGTCPTTAITLRGPYARYYTLDNNTPTTIGGGCVSGCTVNVGAKPILLHS
jgi:hypothetical protein